jgi:hypothetical protein
LGGAHAGGVDAWVARYDAAGTQQWIRQFGTSFEDSAGGVAGDGFGGVYVSGTTRGSLGGPNAGDYDAWFARLDAAGNTTWIRQLGTVEFDDGGGIATDGSGGFYVSGSTEGSFVGANAGGMDSWCAHYDGAALQTWIRQFGSSASDFVGGIAADGFGGIYHFGYTYGSLGGPGAGFGDAVYAHRDGAGNLTWIRQIGTSGWDGCSFVVADPAGGLHAGGQANGSLAGPYFGNSDAWLARADPSGNLLATRQVGTSSFDSAFGAALDPTNGLFVSGGTWGNLGGSSFGQQDGWLALFNDQCAPPTSYCTAKTNSLGCLPSISLSSLPSASAGSGCTLSTTQVIGNRSGLFFHSKTGPIAAPFHGGFMCVKSPTRRHALWNSGGTSGVCDGVFTEDFNAYISTGADPGLVAGVNVWIQTWSRDAAAPFGDSLSNGVTTTICP